MHNRACHLLIVEGDQPRDTWPEPVDGAAFCGPGPFRAETDSFRYMILEMIAVWCKLISTEDCIITFLFENKEDEAALRIWMQKHIQERFFERRLQGCNLVRLQWYELPQLKTLQTTTIQRRS